MYVDTVTRTHGRSDRREGSQTDRWTGERMDTRVDKQLGEWMVWRTDVHDLVRHFPDRLQEVIDREGDRLPR